MGKLTHTVSGSIATFRSADKTPIDELKVTLPVVQTGSGDPSPTNIRPLVPWTGVNVTHTGRNLLGGDAMKDMFLANNDNDTSRWYPDDRLLWLYSGNNATGAVYFKGIFKENTQYTIILKMFKSSNTALNARFYYTDGTSENVGSLPVDSSDVQILVATSAQGKTINYIGGYKRNNYADKIYVDYSGIFEGVLTAEDFVAYQGSVIPVTWEVENGFYCGNLDVATGVLTKTFAYANCGEMSWSSTAVTTDVRRYYSSSKQSYIKYAESNNIAANIYCTNYKTVPFYRLRDATYDKCIAVSEAGSIVIRDTTYTEADPVPTGSEFKAAMDGVYVVYELATPLTYQLTAQQLTALLDYNNIWSDAGGDTEVTYEVIDHLEFLRRRMAPQPHLATATGSIANFGTDMRSYLKQCQIEFTPVQSGSGTPSPSNIRTINDVSVVNVIRSGANIADLVGYSTSSIAIMDVSTFKKTDNSYGTTLDKTTYDPQDPTVVVTQASSTTDYGKTHYRNGYFIVAAKGLVFGKRYCVSFKVTNITSNPLDTALSEMCIQNPNGSNYFVTYVDGNRVIIDNYIHTQNQSYPNRSCFEIRVCGMSFTLSELMVTPETITNVAYEPYNGSLYSVMFPTLGKNLLDITKTSKLNPGATGSNITIANGVISIDAVATSSRTYVTFLQTFPAGTYTIKALNSGSVRIPALLSSSAISNSSYNSYYLMYSKSLTNENTLTFTLTEPSTLGLVLPNNTVGEPGTLYNIQLESGSYATTYEAYSNNVYGGTLDLIGGVLTVTWAGISSTWGDGTSATDMGSGITRKLFPMVDYLQTGTDNNKCNVAPYSSSENADIHFYYGGSGSTGRKARVFLPSDTSNSTPVVIVTKLSEPSVYVLTPQQIKTFIGQNNIFADTNENTTVKYWKH